LADVPAHRAGRQTLPPCACLHERRAAEGRRPADHEFLSLLAKSEPPPGWNLDEGGCFLLLPLAERDRAWVTKPCRDHTERGWHAFPGGEAMAFARGRGFAFTRVLAL